MNNNKSEEEIQFLSVECIKNILKNIFTEIRIEMYAVNLMKY
jgi:hypothetical protein